MIINMGKATAYKGINFRSRLEARWAAMFDLLGWAWEYEPETDGFYIPDFVLHGPRGQAIYVEVKPLATWLGDKKAITAKALDGIGFGEPLLVLTDQFNRAISFDVQVFGYLANSNDDGDEDHAILFQPGAKEHGLEYDFAGEFGSWAGRLTGAYDGNGLFESSQVSRPDLLLLWSRAGNAIQWKPK